MNSDADFFHAKCGTRLRSPALTAEGQKYKQNVHLRYVYVTLGPSSVYCPHCY